MHRLSLKIAFLVFVAFGLFAQNPHGKGFKMDCIQCHDSGSWTFSKSNATFSHANTGFILTGQHQNVDCKACHTSLSFASTKSTCVSCHQDLHNQTVGNECARCHTTQTWVVENITKLHEQTSFPLVGVHAKNDCNSCHKTETNIKFKPIGLACVDCHTKDFKAAQNPNHEKLKLSNDCASCHTAVPDWAGAAFPDHNEFYPLTGGHAVIANECEKCHIGGKFAGTPTECVGCHNPDFKKTVNPDHVSLGLSTDCASCHTTAIGWSPSKFANHDAYFPLTGAHATIANDCAKCHKNGNFSKMSSDCSSCHNNEFQTAQNPNHLALGFSKDCATCHTTAPGWSPATFSDHDKYYPLREAHTLAKCSECHIGGNFSNTPKDCNSCHKTDYKSSKNPDHVTMGLSSDCASCHTTKPGWRPTTFDHNAYYPLTGGHSAVANNCTKCHSSGNVKDTPTECSACHDKDFKTTVNPNHVSLKFSNDCASCHTTAPGWTPAKFTEHDKYFALTGVHSNVSCDKCHIGGNYSNTPKDCNGCHSADFKKTISPNHVSIGLSTDCASCHTTTSGWSPSTFKHDGFYSLTGGHALIAKDCAKCHKSADAKNTPKDCYACHTATYQNTKNPPHGTMSMSTDCASCHTTAPGWTPTNFDHGKYWALTGAHVNISKDCNKCHKAPNYMKPGTDCNSCHNGDYKSSVNPNHAAIGLSTDCATCHTTNAGWRPTSFNHDTYFALTGGHAVIAKDCAKCHKTSDIKNTPKECYSCHTATYNGTKNPSHSAMSMSTDCATCHTTAPGWTPTNFDHGKYWVLTGAHVNISKDCNKCHKAPNYMKPGTDCNSCHNGDYKSASNPNHEAIGLSTDCATCHTTNAGWRPTSFNHDTYFQLTGGHAVIAKDCAKCHKGGDIKNTPKDCYSCHTATYNGTKNPSHSAMSMSTDCATCHTTAPGWTPTNFDHGKYWVLTGAHVNISKDCNKCHKAPNYMKPGTDCNACHNGDYKASVNPNHAAIGLSTDCATCHTTNAGWRPTSFNHDTYFALTGGHAVIAKDCAKCHKTSDIKNTPKDCYSCHTDTYNGTKNPSHSAMSMSTDCSTCHTTAPGWTPTNFDHGKYWALTGAHVNISKDCNKCHKAPNYMKPGTDCNACHNGDYKASVNPNHAAIGLSTDCATCHTTNAGWRPTSFNHDTYFALTGGHAVIAKDCAKCHKGGDIKNTPKDCYSCHSATYNGTKNPSHSAMSMSTDCATCHTTAPGWTPTNFDHGKYWVLTGAHVNISKDCNKCHKAPNYMKPGTDCNGCHNGDYKASVNPNHAAIGLSTDCATCHTTNAGWRPTSFNHDTYFALTGGHSVIAKDCAKCHKTSDIKNTPKDCYSCHTATYNGTKNPSHSAMSMSTDCATCHTTAPGWTPTNFDHGKYWVLTGAHTNISKDCNKCHKAPNYMKPGTDCNSCHNGDYKASVNPNHAAIGLSTDCATCHTTNAGWRPTSFNHDTYFALTGGHAVIAKDCAKCHKTSDIKNTPKDCYSCHTATYNGTKNPSHSAMSMSTDCATCHTTAPGWTPTNFDHGKYWVLTGAHVNISKDCNKCHKAPNYMKPGTDCNACHNGDYKASVNPNHAAIGLSTDCATCHTTNAGWRPTSFNHDTYFALTGGHAVIAKDCAKCHKTSDIKNTPKDCYSCHTATYNGTKNPSHSAMSMSTDCATCHTTAPGWTPTNFDHGKYWVLTGAHVNISKDCNKCHKAPNYMKPGTDCNSCHNGDYKSAVNPNHAAIGLSTDCATCHTTNAGWRPTSFNHDTYFALTGGHSVIAKDCAKCHKTSDIKNTPKDCYSCHTATYNGTKNPSHSAMSMSTDCATCHTTAPGWTPTNFDHGKYWVLTGAHVNISKDCNKCHKAPNYMKPGTDCNACHNGDYSRTSNPNHGAIGLSTDCASCHTTNPGWRPTTFNHNNYFALTGGHASVASNCTLCHKNADIKNTPTDCNACHNAAYVATKNPGHAAMGMSTDCASCHTTAPGWTPTNFDHGKYWVLTGAHTNISKDCNKCHKAPNYMKPSTDCNACHNADYNSSSSPAHATMGLSTDCVSCHTTAPGWAPTTMNHSTYFALTGAHATIGNGCVKCHNTGNVKNTPTDCNSCHNVNYKAASNPNHVTANFSTDCASCHTTNPGWRPSTFNHNNFYALTGAHASIANNCTLCHKNGNYNNTPTDCNSCHNSAYQGASSPNHVSAGFPTDCASCHTTNPGWRPSTFNHNSYYVLVGAHANIANNCTKCHIGGNFKNAPTNCYGCHTSDYNSASPNHASSHFPTSCTDCHGQSVWKPANWNHDSQHFPIYSGSHKGKWNSCTECHTNASNFGVFTCTSCHKKTEADKDHKSIKGYVYDSNACFSCHPRGKS